jgi:hypothetical protein
MVTLARRMSVFFTKTPPGLDFPKPPPVGEKQDFFAGRPAPGNVLVVNPPELGFHTIL